MAMAAMMAPLKPLTSIPGTNLSLKHQDHGRDDQPDDRAEDAAADGDAQQAQEPADYACNHSNHDCGDDRGAEAPNCETEVQSAHDQEDHGSDNQSDDSIEDNTH